MRVTNSYYPAQSTQSTQPAQSADIIHRATRKRSAALPRAEGKAATQMEASTGELHGTMIASQASSDGCAYAYGSWNTLQAIQKKSIFIS